MRQITGITVFLLAGALGAPLQAFAKGEYIAAYGKAYAEYTHWAAESARQGKYPTAEQKRQKQKLLFADVPKAYVQELGDLHKYLAKLAKDTFPELRYSSSKPSEKSVTRSVASKPGIRNEPNRKGPDIDVKSGAADTVDFNITDDKNAAESFNASSPATR